MKKVSQMLWMKIEKAPTKLDCEHVTKGQNQLDSSVPKWMPLLPRLIPGCSILVNMRYILFVTPAIEDISSQDPRRKMGKSKMISFVFICASAPGYGNGVILNSKDKITETFG